MFETMRHFQCRLPSLRHSGKTNRGFVCHNCLLFESFLGTSITIAVAARDLHFTYRGLRTKIRSLIDIRGFMADFDRQPEYCQLNYDLYLDTDQTKEQMQRLAEETDRRCPQLGLFRRARIPMVISWYREGEVEPQVVQNMFLPEGGVTPEEALVTAAKAAR